MRFEVALYLRKIIYRETLHHLGVTPEESLICVRHQMNSRHIIILQAMGGIISTLTTQSINMMWWKKIIQTFKKLSSELLVCRFHKRAVEESTNILTDTTINRLIALSCNEQKVDTDSTPILLSRNERKSPLRNFGRKKE